VWLINTLFVYWEHGCVQNFNAFVQRSNILIYLVDVRGSWMRKGFCWHLWSHSMHRGKRCLPESNHLPHHNPQGCEDGWGDSHCSPELLGALSPRYVGWMLMLTPGHVHSRGTSVTRRDPHNTWSLRGLPHHHPATYLLDSCTEGCSLTPHTLRSSTMSGVEPIVSQLNSSRFLGEKKVFSRSASTLVPHHSPTFSWDVCRY
jgi:hypothetical protein